jgi:hypothetical protein
MAVAGLGLNARGRVFGKVVLDEFVAELSGSAFTGLGLAGGEDGGLRNGHVGRVDHCSLRGGFSSYVGSIRGVGGGGFVHGVRLCEDGTKMGAHERACVSVALMRLILAK